MKQKITLCHYFTSDEVQYLKEITTGRPYKEIVRLFNERFGLKLNYRQINSKIKRLKLHNGIRPRKGVQPPYLKVYEFKLGHNPPHSRQIGDERVTFLGYVEVKSRKGEWKYKHILIWEAAHGPVPKGHAIIFADRNKANLALDNLLMVSRQELAIMNRKNLICSNAELTRIGKLIADIYLLIADRRSGGKKRNKSA
jgi:hypothetical protein